ncbi:MAG: DUF3592 domain-containing protein [Acidobacteriota bacterium]|nr:DUF3592 domain-containing protein [Acidobacteriota bacterium]
MGIAIFVGLLFFLIGIVILISGIVSIFKTRSRIANSLSADGLVTAFATGMGKSGYLYYPLVQFKIPAGQVISFQSSVGSSRAGYTVGQQVKVLYDARNPQEAEIDDLSSLWLVPGCMLAMGLAFTIGGLFLAVVMTLVMINQSAINSPHTSAQGVPPLSRQGVWLFRDKEGSILLAWSAKVERDVDAEIVRVCAGNHRRGCRFCACSE